MPRADILPRRTPQKASLAAELKWLPGLGVENRMKGDWV
jgi:hypothetical protein